MVKYHVACTGPDIFANAEFEMSAELDIYEIYLRQESRTELFSQLMPCGFTAVGTGTASPRVAKRPGPRLFAVVESRIMRYARHACISGCGSGSGDWWWEWERWESGIFASSLCFCGIGLWCWRGLIGPLTSNYA